MRFDSIAINWKAGQNDLNQFSSIWNGVSRNGFSIGLVYNVTSTVTSGYSNIIVEFTVNSDVFVEASKKTRVEIYVRYAILIFSQ